MTTNPTQSSSEELRKSRDEITKLLMREYGVSYHEAANALDEIVDMPFVASHLQAYTDEIRREVIGDKKISLTDIYGIDWRNNYGYNETQVRDAAIYLQCKQRQALNALATKWGVK
jgi:hypothetical protein